MEGASNIKIKDIYSTMKHKRDLILGVVFRPSSDAKVKELEPVFDNSHLKDLNRKDTETISLDSCFNAFSREELLTGAD